MKVAVYLSAVPSRTKNEAKKDLLTRFAQGAMAAGDSVQIVNDVNTIVESDVAVIQGWIGMKQAPHLEQRRRVIKNQRQGNGHVLVIDSNLFGFFDSNDRDRYLRYSLNGIFPTTGYYFGKNVDPARWEEIKRSYRFAERDWRTQGQYILVCLQRDGGWSMDGMAPMDWLNHVIPQIRSSSSRPIVIRPHPGSLNTIPLVRKHFPNIEISTYDDIRKDFDRAWATVTYNSSPGVASVIWGVPAFITDPVPHRSQAFGYAATDLAQLENPWIMDRMSLYHNLAQCHFANASLVSGEAWKYMRSRLP